MSNSTMELILKDFITMIGLPLEERNSEEPLSLLVDDTMMIHIGERPAGRFVICSTLGEIDEARALQLMSLNAFSEELDPFTIAYDDTLAEAVAWRRLPAGVDAAALYQEFHRFIKELENLRFNLKPAELPKADADKTATDSAAAQKHMMAMHGLRA